MFQIFTSDRGKHCKHREYIVASVVSTSQQPRFDFEYFLILVDFQGKYLCFDHLCLPEVVDHWKHHKDGVIRRPWEHGSDAHLDQDHHHHHHHQHQEDLLPAVKAASQTVRCCLVRWWNIAWSEAHIRVFSVGFYQHAKGKEHFANHSHFLLWTLWLLWMREDVHLPWARAWTKVMMARQMKANSPRTKDGSTFTIMVVMMIILRRIRMMFMAMMMKSRWSTAHLKSLSRVTEGLPRHFRPGGVDLEPHSVWGNSWLSPRSGSWW